MGDAAQEAGWLERKCASYLTKKDWTCVKEADSSYFASKRVDVDAQHSVGASTLLKMEHADGLDSAAGGGAASPPDRPALAGHDPSRHAPKWKEWMSPDNTDDVVIVPSLSLDPKELAKVTGVQFYEERALGFSLLQLCEPTKRVVYCTSAPVAEEIVQYYLRIVCGSRGVNPQQARERLLMICCHDTDPIKNLSAKLLARPRLIKQIKRFLRPEMSYMVCFISTPDEAALGDALGLEVLGTHPELQFYGTKLGSRTLFKEAGIPFPDGTDLVYTEDELAVAVAELWERGKAQRIVVKLNEGFSGEGNALMVMDGDAMTACPDTRARAKLVAAAFSTMEFNNDVWEHFRQGIVKMGALGEAWVEGVSTSPSCQVYITPDGGVEIVSTHEQILDGQVFLGCEFPCADGYRAQLHEYGKKVGAALASHGAMERFAMDFVTCLQPDGSWECPAIEVNLRWGGTTHPAATLRLLTHGHLDSETGVYTSDKGQAKYYYCTDNLKMAELKGLTPQDVSDIAEEHSLDFDHSTQIGVVFHLMGTLSMYGKIGLTCIENSPEAAKALYERTTMILVAAGTDGERD